MEEAEFTPQGKESSKKSVHKRPAGPYCTKAQVLSFVWAICRSIVPTDLLGLPSIWRSLKRNISKFIRLRRFEKFCLKQCMQGLKTSCIPFLSDKCYSGYRGNHVLPKCDKSVLKYKLLSCWIYWLFSYLIVPILMANFYVTESEFGKLDIFFYRKSVWEELATRAITCLREQSYSLLDKTSFQRILSQRSFGFSKVRFSPKKNEMRVLANLKAPSRIPAGKEKGKFRHFMAVNNCLRDLNVVLKGLKMGYPEKLGSSVFDYNDVYKKLSPFLIGLKNGSNIVPKTYIVICDVSKAFDSVDQDKLVSVMNDVMLNDQYHVKSSTQVVCSKKSLWVNSEKELLDDNSSHGIAKSTISFPFHSMHSILINQGTSKTIMKEELSRNLHEHVKCNVLQVGKNFYLQEIGIPQGSVLSSLLFSFYYAHLETNSIFPFLEKVHKAHTLEPSSGDLSRSQRSYMLLRFADDFLFISTSEEQAVSFFSRLQRGFREYNCSINEAKSCMNFNMDHTPSNRVYTGKDGISFLPWSGLLINCRTLEIQADYTRYLDIHISSTLTVCWQDKPGPRLKEKLCQFMRPKCHPIFYDSNINSEAVVKLNVYQAFLLCAMKFHCYVHDLSTICTFPPGYYFEMIKSSISYMHKLIVRRMNFMDFGSVVCRIIKDRSRLSRAADPEEVGTLAMIRGMQAVKDEGLKRVLILSHCSRLFLRRRRMCLGHSWGALDLAPDLHFSGSSFLP
ncbi:hypothetical protein GIB67_032425 [Kingdonia uniflora]|uniref:Telomerase reverse transcriptase n=1 Tax=Kingdonia uniflora TaxID=39325 RepID=A0A7J7MIU2_9MAGN|nr:hypothetical protein GIB67_032425 [Kingdonia uniflora]